MSASGIVVVFVAVVLVMPQVFVVDCMCPTRDVTSFVPGAPCQDSYVPYPYNYPVIGGVPGGSIGGIPGGSLGGYPGPIVSIPGGYPGAIVGPIGGGYPSGSLVGIPGGSIAGYPGGSLGGNYPIISQPYPLRHQQPISYQSSSLPVQYPNVQMPYASTGNGIGGGIAMPVGNNVPY